MSIEVANESGIKVDEPALAALRTSINKPTGTQREQYAFARADLDAAATAMRKLINSDWSHPESEAQPVLPH